VHVGENMNCKMEVPGLKSLLVSTAVDGMVMDVPDAGNIISDAPDCVSVILVGVLADENVTD
jgi:hypothetical protein